MDRLASLVFLGLLLVPRDVCSSTDADIHITRQIIWMTRDVKALCKNFDAIMRGSVRMEKLYDDALLAEEMRARFGISCWPGGFGDRRLLVAPLPSPDLQAICWLAECNKRMCLAVPEARLRQREAILAFLRAKLAAESDPIQIRGALDVAYRAVFYLNLVKPENGGDTIIDLFKQYVTGTDPIVHEFTCDRLRTMGYVWRSRYDEILDFLCEQCPEIRNILTAAPVPGFRNDPLLGMTITACDPEEEWCSLDTAVPSALAQLAEEQLTTDRSNDALAMKAFYALLERSAQKHGDEAFRSSLDLLRKGIRSSHVFWYHALHAARDLPPGESRAALRRLPDALAALREAASANVLYSRQTLRSVLENTLKAVQEAHAKGATYDERKISPVAATAVEQMLAKAIADLGS